MFTCLWHPILFSFLLNKRIQSAGTIPSSITGCGNAGATDAAVNTTEFTAMGYLPPMVAVALLLLLFVQVVLDLLDVPLPLILVRLQNLLDQLVSIVVVNQHFLKKLHYLKRQDLSLHWR